MKALFYDWFGLNAWLFEVFYALNFPFLDGIWKVASYAYSYWAVVFAALAIGVHYLRTRHAASERQLETLGELTFVLVTAFSVVWCCVYTFQNVTLLPRPWMVFPDLVDVRAPLLWHEGLPASAPAISSMLAFTFWKHAGIAARRTWIAYVALGCSLSMVSGVNWPADVAAGVAVGLAGAWIGQWYFRFGRRFVAP